MVKILGNRHPSDLVEVIVGDVVHDDLTGTTVTILQINTTDNKIVVDNSHLEGVRLPWELSQKGE